MALKMIPSGLAARAFVQDQAHVVPCRVMRFEGDSLTLGRLDGTEFQVTVVDAPAFEAILDEPTSTMLSGRRLALINLTYGILGVAFGPPTAPDQLEFVPVVNLDDGSVPPDGDQPGWRLLRVATTPPLIR